MALEIHILGPGLETVRLLHAGETELILGRDTGCDINLPDPERNVSRRHLALWNRNGELCFRVLSSVNGIDMPFGYAPPGARGVLPVGQTMKIGDYSVQVKQPASEPATQDPWAVFESERGASDATLPRASPTAGQPGEFSGLAILPEEDPFGDWGFESTFGPGSDDVALKAVAKGPGEGDMSSFYKGLGLAPASAASLSANELEAAGRAVRVALEGMFALYAAHAGTTPEGGTDTGGLAPVKDNNPLKTRWPHETKLQYLFGGRSASIGFISPQRAVTDIVNELLAHEAAVATATRAAVEGALHEFEPSALKERLLGAGSKLFEGTRAWEAYSRYYGEKSQDLAEWVQQLLDQYFAEAYLRESQRSKHDTGPEPE